MKFKLDIVLDGPIDLVWEARERRFENPEKFPELTKHQELNKRKDGSKLYVKSRIELASKVPDALKKILKPEMLNMIDDSVYDLDAGTHTWTYTPEAKSPFFSAKGRSQYTEFEEGGKKKTRRRMEQDVTVSIPLIGKLAEQFIIDQIRKNVDKDTAGMQKMLKMMQEEQE